MQNLTTQIEEIARRLDNIEHRLFNLEAIVQQNDTGLYTTLNYLDDLNDHTLARIDALEDLFSCHLDEEHPDPALQDDSILSDPVKA